jgi:hypothetical protein
MTTTLVIILSICFTQHTGVNNLNGKKWQHTVMCSPARVSPLL